jgi:hypothetical protein
MSGNSLTACFSTYYPIVLAVILLGTTVYNILRDHHVKREMEVRNIPTWLRFPAILSELGVVALAFYGLNALAVLLATGLLMGSIAVCLLRGWRRRLWLSIPLLVLNLLWYAV